MRLWCGRNLGRFAAGESGRHGVPPLPGRRDEFAARERRGCLGAMRSAEKVLCISDKSGAWSRLSHVCGPDVISTATVNGAREISAGRSPLAKQVARAVRARRNHVISPEGAQRLSAEGGSMRGVVCPQTAGRYPPNEVSRVAGAMRGASRSGQVPDYPSRNIPAAGALPV